VKKYLSAEVGGGAAGAESIDDLNLLRAGGTPILFDGVYAPSTLGTLLREFTFGHARQLESVLRQHLITLAERTDVLTGIDEQAFIDIDSLLRPVYGTRQARRFLRTHQDRRQTAAAQGIVAAGHHDQHRAGHTGDRWDAATRGKGRLWQRRRTDGRPSDRHRAGGWREREDPGPRRLGLRQPRGGARLRARQRRVLLGDDQKPGHPTGHRRHPGHRLNPGALPGRGVRDPDTGAWISDAEVAEVPYTAFATTRDRITARLIVRRVKDARYPDALSRSGATTRSSPTRPCPPSKPTSPTAATRSSKPCSQT
jgi:hypothetical protein